MRESRREHARSLEAFLASLRDGINYAYSRALHSTPFCTGCNLTGTFGSCFARDEEDEEEDDSGAREGEGRSRRRTRRTKKRAAEENERRNALSTGSLKKVRRCIGTVYN